MLIDTIPNILIFENIIEWKKKLNFFCGELCIMK